MISEFSGREGVHEIKALVMKGQKAKFGYGGGRLREVKIPLKFIYGCPLLDNKLFFR